METITESTGDVIKEITLVRYTFYKVDDRCYFFNNIRAVST